MYGGLRFSKQVSEKAKKLLRVLLFSEFFICLNFLLLLLFLLSVSYKYCGIIGKVYTTY